MKNNYDDSSAQKIINWIFETLCFYICGHYEGFSHFIHSVTNDRRYRSISIVVLFLYYTLCIAYVIRKNGTYVTVLLWIQNADLIVYILHFDGYNKYIQNTI